MTCPKCGSNDLRRSATRWSERPRRLLKGGRALRCRACNWRGWQDAEPGQPARHREPSASSYSGGRETAYGAFLMLVIVGLVLALLLVISRPGAPVRNSIDLRPPSQIMS
jgi:hypothetical protein